MPEADTTRKRSRSPSDADLPKHKRANTGATSDDLRTRDSATSASARNDRMELPSAIDDTAASTPSPSADKTPITSAIAGTDLVAEFAAATSAGPGSSQSTSASTAANIHMRCLIVTQDASIIIGKAGTHVNEIREKSGARVMVSESIPGNPERILNVSGPLDAVSKVCLRCAAVRNQAYVCYRHSVSSYGESMTSRLTSRLSRGAGQ